MVKILIATKNRAKFERYKRIINYLRPDFTIVNLSDLSINVRVDEIGITSEEISRDKAIEYLKHSKLPTLAIDEECYVDGAPDEKQPKIFVRRIGGTRETTDEEILNYFLTNYAGKWHTWTFSHCLALPDDRTFSDKAVVRAYFHTKPHKEPVIKGYPLSNLLYDPKIGKYWRDFTTEEEKIVLKQIYVSIEKILNQAFSNRKSSKSDTKNYVSKTRKFNNLILRCRRQSRCISINLG